MYFENLNCQNFEFFVSSISTLQSFSFPTTMSSPQHLSQWPLQVLFSSPPVLFETSSSFSPHFPLSLHMPLCFNSYTEESQLVSPFTDCPPILSPPPSVIFDSLAPAELLNISFVVELSLFKMTSGFQIVFKVLDIPCPLVSNVTRFPDDMFATL